MRLRFLSTNIYGHTVKATQFLGLRLTVQTQNLKY